VAEETIPREFFRTLGKLRWRGKSEEQKSEHGKLMAAAKKERKRRRREEARSG
jgi:hypothetical protein